MEADEGQIEQILLNLYVNAADAMPGGGLLTIKATRDDKRVTVTVSDTGEGMNRETLEKCFDPFYTTKDVGKGTGLGLSISYGIIKDHKGTIEVAQTGPEGTAFLTRLPAA